MTTSSTECGLTADQRYTLLRSVGEECIQENELRNLVEKKPNIRCYDGFEPSGRMHIAQGIFKAVNVNKCTRSGCEFVFWVADWFALMNDKMGGELAKIRIVGKYLIEVWKAAGMDMSKVIFLWSSEEITNHADTYWKIVLDIGRRNSIARIKKCCTIMGKSEGTLTAAQVLYPLMQSADIFFLKADICQLGLDQRKVNMLAREYCDLIGRKLKPVILSHHMLSGLKQGQAKMSKSDPDSAVFMEDSTEDVARKIIQAYCPKVAQKPAHVTDDGAPESTDDKNPVLDYYQCIAFSGGDRRKVVAGGRIFTSYEELETAFLSDELSEMDLKQGLVDTINAILDPVRTHFAENSEAAELLEQVKSFRKGAAAITVAHEAPVVQGSRPRLVAFLPAIIRLPLDTTITLVSQLNRFVEENAASEGEGILVLPDWSAFACNDITGEEKDIAAALQLNVAMAKAYGLSEKVRIVTQKDVILNHRSEYWVTAINVGRQNSLERIEQVLGGEIKNAGYVVACMMRVADVILLGGTHVLTTSHDGRINELVLHFTKDRVKEVAASTMVIPPLHDPKVPPVLLANDDILFADDTQMDIQRKIKRAYCAPNESANAVVELANWCMGHYGHFKVSRPDTNGGDVQYDSAPQLAKDAEIGSLHPGDLKAAVLHLLLQLSARAREALTTPDVKKHSQTLRNAEKKLSKKKAGVTD